jgi:hypothetical protein
MPRVDHIVHNGRGDIIAICGALTDPAHRRIAGKLEDLCEVGIDQSSLQALSPPMPKAEPSRIETARDLRAESAGTDSPPAPIQASRHNESEDPAKARSM